MATAEEYRDTAIYKSIRYHMYASEFALRCAGCGLVLHEMRKGGWDGAYLDRGDVEHRLAELAIREGWDIDGSGSVACKACTERLASRGKEGTDETESTAAH